MLLGVFVVVVLLWITSPLHEIDSTVIALFGISILLVARVLEWRDIMDETHAWEVFIWYGGLVMMAAALGETNLPKLFAENIAFVTNGWSWTFALRGAGAGLLLLALRLCEHHGARLGDVYARSWR